MKSILLSIISSLIGAVAWSTVSFADVRVDVPVLTIPSLSAFTLPIIKAQKFDHANGLDVHEVIMTAQSYRTDFAAGTIMVGGSGTLLADIAKLNEMGVKTVYLFNVFNFWGTVVVPSNSSIHTLKDLEGKTLAAALPTTNYAMFRYFAQAAGADVSKIKVQGSTIPGLIALAAAHRVDAVEMWEPAYSVLTYGNHKFRSIDIVDAWKKKTGEEDVPYLGVAAHKDWADSHKDVIQKLYKTYQMAANFIKKNPEKAARLISSASKGELKPEVLVSLMKSNRFGLSVYWGANRRDAADKIFGAAVASHYLKRMPDPDVLYDGK